MSLTEQALAGAEAEAAAGGRSLTLGTAGHIDHGKTSLIEALTGRNTDRLAEERRRGISIELGFAELRLPGDISLGVVDVPGHERLVRTMVAGAAGIDLFLLVVAADDGVMPQTLEHLAVLRAFEVSDGVVALSKCDLGDDETRLLAADEVGELLPAIPVVEVSARTGMGLDALREALADAARRVASRPRRDRPAAGWPEPAVLHVDRSFSLHGAGTVVTGTLWSGAIEAGERLTVLPDGREARARTVHVHDREVTRAVAGQRVALNLAGAGRDEVSRGDVVATGDAELAASYRLDVELELASQAGDLEHRRVQLHHGTRDVAARVVPLGDGLAQLRLEAPVVARPGDRFVIRRIAPPDTLGGGVVIDPRPRRHGAGPASERLRLLRDGEPEELLAATVREVGRDGIAGEPTRWLSLDLLGPALRRFAVERWREAVAGLIADGVAVQRRDRLYSAELPPPEPAQAQGAGRAPRLDRAALGALRALLDDGVEPRAPQPLADALGLARAQAVELLEQLVGAGLAVRVKADVYYPAEALDRVRAQILDLARPVGSISLPELRDGLGTSRKYAQALLEYLDASKVTVRQGDRHVLRRGAPAEPDA